MKQRLKKVAARLPLRWQQELKRRYFGRQIRRSSFRTDEPEYDLIPGMISPGDWVLDVGANIGHYTLWISELVGASGRVISFEPVPATFELLAANAALARSKNITLMNVAVSDSPTVSWMTIPKRDESGLDDFYMAQLTEDSQGSGLQVLCISVDSLALPHAVRLVKIDAEGHELSVIQGMKGLLERDHPILVVEDNDPEVVRVLEGLGYSFEKVDGSSNRIFRPINLAAQITDVSGGRMEN